VELLTRPDFQVIQKIFKEGKTTISIIHSKFKGTRIKISGLFYQYPLRRRLMKQTVIDQQVRKMIGERWLLNHSVAISYRSDGISFEFPAQASLVHAIQTMFPSNTIESSQLKHLEWKCEEFTATGVYSNQPVDHCKAFLCKMKFIRH
jgi:DNA mismatch repair ATPase MutL